MALLGFLKFFRFLGIFYLIILLERQFLFFSILNFFIHSCLALLRYLGTPGSNELETETGHVPALFLTFGKHSECLITGKLTLI